MKRVTIKIKTSLQVLSKKELECLYYCSKSMSHLGKDHLFNWEKYNNFIYIYKKDKPIGVIVYYTTSENEIFLNHRSKIIDSLTKTEFVKKSTTSNDKEKVVKRKCGYCSGTGSAKMFDKLSREEYKRGENYRRAMCTNCMGTGWVK